jgi:lactate dehydrogenase-like 2-hydroxyacid dehydrogenase
MSGWARISGLKMLHESTLGIVGFGEIGREVAMRATLQDEAPYHQRHQPQRRQRYGGICADETLLRQATGSA